MSNYKAETTLNERDSLQDMLTLEKGLVKLYSTALTEGVSNGFRTVVKDHWNGAVSDQLDVFFQMTEHGYYRVESASEDALEEQKEKFKPILNQLS